MGFRRRLMMAQRSGGNIPNYLCLTALEAGTFTFTYGSGVGTGGSNATSISYSTDGVNWTKLDNVANQTVSITTPTIAAGDKVYWKGTNGRLSIGVSANQYSGFSSTGDFDVSGSISSIISDEIPATISNTNNFSRCFYNSRVVDASDLTLPSNSTNGSYYGMFEGCSKLQYAPPINISSLTNNACKNMFLNCSALIEPPTISATYFAGASCQSMFQGCTTIKKIAAIGNFTFGGSDVFKTMYSGCSSLVDISGFHIKATTTNNVYRSMFEKCSSIVNMPKDLFDSSLTNAGSFGNMFENCKDLTDAYLPSSKLLIQAYYCMFRYCSKMSYIKMLATDVSGTNCMNSWLYGAPNNSSCIFVKHIDAQWTTTGVDGVPTNWTIIYYDPALDKYYTDQTRATECDDHGNPL